MVRLCSDLRSTGVGYNNVPTVFKLLMYSVQTAFGLCFDCVFTVFGLSLDCVKTSDVQCLDFVLKWVLVFLCGLWLLPWEHFG